MDSQDILEKFERFAEIPGAIHRLRGLILDLAILGHLGTSSVDDEPAAELLSRIKERMDVLRKERLVRDKELPPLDPKLMPPLPIAWQWVRLGNVVRYGSPEKVASSEIPPEAWLLDLEDVEKESSRLLVRKAFSDSPSKSTKAAFGTGDVLYCKLRPYLNKVLVADEDGYCTTEIIAIRGFGLIDPHFLCYALRRPAFVAYANSKTYGINLPRLSTQDARNAPLPLPPLAEQKRIVAKVDELMALCDRLEQQLAEREARHAELARAALARFADDPTPANLEYLFHESFDIDPADLRKSILTMAVQGKLAKQQTSDGDAHSALESLSLAGGNCRVRRNVPDSVPKGPSVDERCLPSTWALMSTASLLKLGAIIDLKDGNHGANHPKVSEFTEHGLPFITAAQVSDGGTIDYDGAYKVDGAVLERLRVGFAHPNDVIYTHKGSVGRVAICDRQCVLSPQTTYYRVDEKTLTSRYLDVYLRSPQFRIQVDEVKRQTTRDFVSIAAQYRFFLRIPPVAEQQRIAERVDQLLTLVDQLEEGQLHAKRLGERLLEAAVAELTQPQTEAA